MSKVDSTNSLLPFLGPEPYVIWKTRLEPFGERLDTKRNCIIRCTAVAQLDFTRVCGEDSFSRVIVPKKEISINAKSEAEKWDTERT